MTIIILSALALIGAVWVVDTLWDMLHVEDEGRVSKKTLRRYRNER